MVTETQNADPDGWVAASKRIRCRMVTKTPIEIIKKALVLAFRHVGCYEDSDFKTVPNARAALEDVGALVAALEMCVYELNEAMGDGSPNSAGMKEAWEHGTAALVPFQAKT